MMMANKVYVVTGVTSRIGQALATDLAKRDQTLVMIARDAGRGKAVRKEIAQATRNPNLDLQLCNLAILSSVRNLAEILKSRYERIDGLINNATIYRRKRIVTAEGLEEMFAANYLGPFLLTNLLLEQLQAAVQANGSARILNITSPSEVELNFDDLQSARYFHSLKTFGATKMAKLLFTFMLARRLESTGITVNAVHPGLSRLGLMEQASVFTRFFTRLVAISPQKAAESITQVAVSPEFEETTGKFLENGKEIEAPAYAHDRDVQERFWKISESLSELSFTKGVLPVDVHEPQF
jgi:NAD(P)-dependent dehydrogenase (short-subunit alcohol dehydrogenase family)